MRKLDANDCHRCGLDGLEPEHRCTSSLDRSVILLDDVVEVLAGSNMHAPPRRMLSPKQQFLIIGVLGPHSKRARAERVPAHRLRQAPHRLRRRRPRGAGFALSDGFR
jgi:hypothetical protein